MGSRALHAVFRAASPGCHRRWLLLSIVAAGDTVHGDAQAALGVASAAMIAIGPTTDHIYAGNGWNTGLKARLGWLAVVGRF